MLKKVVYTTTLTILILLVASTASFAKSKETVILKNKDAPTIDIGLPVTMSKCSPCHESLDRVDYESIKIPHYNHLKKGVPCQGCHIDLPHDGGKLNKPPMEACFTCHGLNHGPQELMAPTKCDVCHPGDFNLVPKNHTAEWKESGHKHEDAQSRKRCVLCHQDERNTCRTCHKNDKDLPYTLAKSIKSNVEPGSKRYRISPTGVVSISKCSPCHDNWDRVEYEKIRFYHSKHFAKATKCDFCHQSFPHRRGYIIKPEMKQCFTCHDTDHGTEVELAPGDCLKCHPANFNLKPITHNSQWVSEPPYQHSIQAMKNKNECLMCHRQEFCDNCHQTEMPHAPDWRSEHGKEAVSRVGADNSLPCFKCHKPESSTVAYQKPPSCAKCHKAVVYPHRKPWAPQHGKTAESVGKAVCFTCHVQAAFCNKCHGGVTMPHAKGWLGKHRQFLRDNKVNACLNCHEKGQCEKCHSAHKVHNRYTNYDFGRP